jgi:glutaminyl-peptide cyclotransferase
MRLFYVLVLIVSLSVITNAIPTVQQITTKILSFGARVPNSVGHDNTREYIVDLLSHSGKWKIRTDYSIQSTPNGQMPFKNIIATFSHGYCGTDVNKIVLAAHYDSKILKEGIFLGATDSVVPLSIILNLALKYENYAPNNCDKILQLIFFDGEEAIHNWSDTDSLCKKINQDY